MTAAGQIIVPLGAGGEVPPWLRHRAATQRRGVGAALSALLHVAVVVLALRDLGLFDDFAPVMEEAIPVEVVLVPPEVLREPVREEPEVAAPEPEPAPAEESPPAPEGQGGERVAPELETNDDPDQTPETEQAREDKTAPEQKPEQPTEEPAVLTAPLLESTESDVGDTPIGRAKLKPEARPNLPPGRQQAALPATSGYVGEWILDPLYVDYGHRCGSAKVRGRMRLTHESKAGRFEGVLRTTIVWALCPAEGARYQVLVSIRGDKVTMTGSGGFVDRGVIRDGVMRLNDAYGSSVWRRR